MSNQEYRIMKGKTRQTLNFVIGHSRFDILPFALAISDPRGSVC